jgi:hypothetical protein
MTYHEYTPNSALSTSRTHEARRTNRREHLLPIAAVGLGTMAVLSQLIPQDVKSQAPETTTVSFSDQVEQALSTGPTDESDILGTFPIKQDRTIGNAILQEAAKAGHPIDITSQEGITTVTLSSNKFGSSYQPEDTFVLYTQDVNHDGTPEVLAVNADTESK